MIEACELLEIANEKRKINFVVKYKELLASLEKEMTKAASDGLTEITDIFIDHRDKAVIKLYLANRGFKVTELKMGNTFTISWVP